MNFRFQILAVIFVPSFLFFASCGQKATETDSHGQELKSTSTDNNDHNNEENGTFFEEGKGILLVGEASKSIGLELDDVVEREIQPQLSITAQVYRSAAEPTRRHGRERTGNAYATALVSETSTNELRVGQEIVYFSEGIHTNGLDGVVCEINTNQVPVLEKTEVLMELRDPNHKLHVGSSVNAKIRLSSVPISRLSIPISAVLETTTGTYAFVKSGRHLVRTKIKTGITTADYIEVTEGLYEGDTVAMKAVETLYMIELRATKGGGHCH